MAENLPEFEISNDSGDPVDVRNITGTVPGSGVPGEVNPAQSLQVAGSDGTNLRTLLTDEEGRLITTAEVVSQFPANKHFLRKVLGPGRVEYFSHTLDSRAAFKELHIGGRVACEGSLARYHPSNIDLFGGFNSIAQVAAWSNTSAGSSALLSWAYATDQFTEGTGSAKMTFTQSDNNNYPEISYTFPTPRDLSSWRYIKAQARVTVAAGGSQTRRVQVILRSGTATRIWEVAGTTTTPPFSTEQWHQITGEIENPTSVGGTGTFDINNVTGISLKLLDGGNKAGSIWWDNVHFYSEIELVDKIYSANGTTIQIQLDPVNVFEIGEDFLMAIKNTSANTDEVQISVSGVNI